MIYAIGDIHGELRKLHRLVQKLETAGLKPDDRLVFIGDYVDRGPESSGVIELLIRLRDQRPNTVFLRGNHDQAMMDARDVFDPTRTTERTLDDVAWWFSYGAKETIASYPDTNPSWHQRIPPAHWEFLESTQMEYRESGYIFVHAGLVPPDEKWCEPNTDPRLWIREKFIGSKADFGGIVVFGHTPQDLFMPCVMANKVGIDTGACYGGPLTAISIDPSKPYQREKASFVNAT
ncbi:MAG TPA: metallophosphoesterase family protein [Fimbriimonas sp.]|nr:metallophosphoesterase family protein [Fimbriimonas sp.]